IRGRWRRDLEEVLSAPLPYLAQRFPQIDKLTPARLREGLKGGASPLAHPFFNAIEALLAADRALQEALQQQVLQLSVELARAAPQLLQQRKELANVHTYDDLLTKVASALGGEGGPALAAWI